MFLILYGIFTYYRVNEFFYYNSDNLIIIVLLSEHFIDLIFEQFIVRFGFKLSLGCSLYKDLYFLSIFGQILRVKKLFLAIEDAF